VFHVALPVETFTLHVTADGINGDPWSFLDPVMRIKSGIHKVRNITLPALALGSLRADAKPTQIKNWQKVPMEVELFRFVQRAI
jgi:hypothetical protein